MSNKDFIEVVFFDLGNTLVGSNRDWLPGAEATLAELVKRNIRLGVISNTDTLSRPDILKLLPENFNLVPFEENLLIFSSEVQLVKPAREIFRLALKRANVNPGKCLFCTEEASHISNAQEEGMQTFIVQKPPNSDIGQLVDKLMVMELLPDD